MAYAALTRLTLSNTLRQPVTWLMTGLALLLIVFSCIFGMFNFHSADKIRLISTSGVAIHMLHGLFLAIVLSSAAIHDELNSRTALTLFAKPVSRGSFLLGKLSGVFLTVLITSLLILIAHVIALQIMDEPQRYVHRSEDDSSVLWSRLACAHLFAVCNTMIFCSLSAVLALRLHLVLNIVCSFSLFALAHLLGALHWSGATLIPALSFYNIDSSLQFQNLNVSTLYVLGTCTYTLLFCTGCVCLGLALLKAQDIP
jgi:ABC-type transport system involved in multi-copper enzyme maturation permease subunit